MKNLRVIIAGGGIGGLTAAIALRQAGLDAVVLERAASVDDVALGAGVHLWSNALQALQEIDMAKAVATAGTTVTAHRYLSWQGRLLGTLGVDEVSEGLGAPTVGLSRPELHRTASCGSIRNASASSRIPGELSCGWRTAVRNTATSW